MTGWMAGDIRMTSSWHTHTHTHTPVYSAETGFSWRIIGWMTSLDNNHQLLNCVWAFVCGDSGDIFFVGIYVCVGV